MTAGDTAAPDGGRTLWHGRFATGPSDELLAYTVSLPFDQRLWHDDLVGSRAHVAMLAHVGLLRPDEHDAIAAALDTTSEELAGGRFAFVPSDEDIHTAVERRVTELAGPAGAKMHTGRSRNDQCATDLRLWSRRELLVIAGRVIGLQRVLLEHAEAAGSAYLPGYTHMQRAQPVLLATGLIQTIPSLALLAFLIPITRSIGVWPAMIALFLYALLPIARNTHAGILGIATGLKEAARALGFVPQQVLRYVELPLAMPTILAGVKTSAVINVGTATIAAFIGAGGFGERIAQGLALNDHTLLLAGALPAAALALVVHGIFEAAERAYTRHSLGTITKW